jgi:TonB family protein
VLIFLLTLAATGSHEPHVNAATPVQRYSSTADYPAVAVAHGWEGDVVADLTISPTGQVTACKIVKSSSHKVLDDATCDLFMKRAIFKPARDENGNPREDHILTQPMRWRLSG